MALADVLIKIGGDTSHYERSMRDIKLATKKTTAAVTTMWIGAGSAIYGAYKVWDMAKAGAKMEQERRSFDNLAASYGRTGQSIIDDLRKASAETVDMMTLVNKAGTAMMMGINPSELSKLMAIARATSRQTGQSVVEAFSDISLAVGRQSKMILDNLGIIVRVEDANEKYAKSLGKTTGQLTDADKKQAFLNATIAAGNDLMKRMGNENTTAAEKAQQVEASIKDIGNSIGTFLIPNLESWAEWLKNIDEYWSRVLMPKGDPLLKHMQNQLKSLEQERASMMSITIGRDSGSLDKYMSWIPGYITQEEADKAIQLLDKRIEVMKQSIAGYMGELKTDTVEKSLTNYFGELDVFAAKLKTEAPERSWYEEYIANEKVIRDTDSALKDFFSDLDTMGKKISTELGRTWFDDFLDNEHKLHNVDSDLTAFFSDIDKKSSDLGKKMDKTFSKDLGNAVTGWASNFSATLNDALWESDFTFSAIARSFGKMITQMMLEKQVIEPFMENAGNWISTAITWVGSYFSGGGAAASARGNVFAGYGINAYENRIVDRPVLFPFARGIGLMGEGTRPEGILPLKRMSSGNLGVEAQYSYGGPQRVIYVDQRHSTYLDQETQMRAMDNVARLRVENDTIRIVRDDFDNDGWTRQHLGKN